jgi:hypothetical protein
MNTPFKLLASAVLLAASGISAVDAQRQNPSRTTLPACETVEVGAICRGENGRRMRRQAGEAFGGGDVGFAIPEVDDEVLVQQIDGDPDRPIVNGRVMNGRDGAPVSNGQDGSFSGDDVGFGIRSNAPTVQHMECESCDSDEDEPQEPSNPRPAPGRRSGETPPTEPDPEDCEWNNPAGGPDQENCDE